MIPPGSGDTDATMKLRTVIASATLIAAAPETVAQDLTTTQLQDHGDVVLRGALTKSMLDRNRGNARRNPTATTAKARAKCAAATRAGAVRWGGAITSCCACARGQGTADGRPPATPVLRA